jgi:hypothetical protein
MDVPLVEKFLDMSLDILILYQRMTIDCPIGQRCTGGQIDGVLNLEMQRCPGRWGEHI